MENYILKKANIIIKDSNEAYIGAIDKEGFPFISTISPIKTDGIFKAYFATGKQSHKIKSIENNDKIGLCYHKNSDNISLTGTGRILSDQPTKDEFWNEDFKTYFTGKDDPNYIILEFTTEKAVLFIENQSAEFFIKDILNIKSQSRCGVICSICPWKEPYNCGGCVETMGKPFHGECSIAHCCQEKDLNHCGECDIMPCDKLYEYSYADSEHGDNPPGARVETCRRWAMNKMNVLLTSSGFEDENGNKKVNIINRFLNMLNKPIENAKILFIPTAAINDEAKKMADLCILELINVGAKKENITIYNIDIDGSLDKSTALKHDAIYFTGGDTSYLLKKIKETNFDEIIKSMVYNNKVYVGVSAGSLIAAPNIENSFEPETSGLCLINAFLSVHGKESPTSDYEHISLKDGQALAVSYNGYELIL